jgi:superfamily II DNA or RNA helicase
MTHNQSITLRDYQSASVNDIISAIAAKKNTVIQLPTGTGKTTVIAEVIRLWRSQHSQNQRALIVVHRIELVEQIIDRFKEFGIIAGKIKAGEPVNENYQIQVGLIQSLRSQTRRPASLGLIIVDEAHHINASSYSDLISYYEKYNPTVIGVTATPSRLDGKPLGSVFAQLYEYGQITDFITNGFLSSMKHFATGFPDLKYIKVKSTGDYDEKQLQAAMSNELIMANLIQGYEMHAQNKKMIVFAVNTEHANIIANRYCVAGYNAIAVDYKTATEVRKKIIDDFKNGQIQILVNVNLFTEGFDCPDVEVVQLARPTKSLNLYLQMIGRGMRIFPGKEHGIILDNAKLWEEHGLATRERKWSIDGLDKSDKSSIKVCVKSTNKENPGSENEIPQESNQLELIEIIQEQNNSPLNENPKYRSEEKLLHQLLLPDTITKIEKKLNGNFRNSKNLKIAISQNFLKHSITGQSISTRVFCNIIGARLSPTQNTISKKTLVEHWTYYRSSQLSEEYIKIHDCYNLIITWKEANKLIYPNRHQEMERLVLKENLRGFDRNKVFRFLNLPDEFLKKIREKINLEQVDLIYKRIIDVHSDEIARIINNSGKRTIISQKKVDIQPIQVSKPEIQKTGIIEYSKITEPQLEYRLAKVAVEFNRSYQVLADVLNKHGFNVIPKPTTKITVEMHKTLRREFNTPRKKEDPEIN